MLCLVALTGSLALAGCAGPQALTSPTTGSSSANAAGPTPLATSALPPAAIAATLAPLGTTPTVQGTPTEAYHRVAQRALTCWFGSHGPLKKTHVFNAEVPPPSKGSGAEIFIHEREIAPLPNQSPRGARVYRIAFVRESDETTRMSVETGKLPPDLAVAMDKDAVAWVSGRDSCEAQVVRPPPPDPEPEKKQPKKRARTASR